MSELDHQDYIDSLDQETAMAYKANFEVFKGGKTKHEIAQYYDKWAEQEDYDLHLSQDRYSGPEACAHAIADHFTETERLNAHVLDVAAGTGRLGGELYTIGFRHLDALDPSEGMLKRAKERAVYTHYINNFVDLEHPIPVSNGWYDGIGCSGGFGKGHIPCEALHEFVRVVKQGGVICIAMREEYLDEVTEYKDVFQNLLSDLEASGLIRLTVTHINNYAFGKRGLLFTLEVL